MLIIVETFLTLQDWNSDCFTAILTLHHSVVSLNVFYLSQNNKLDRTQVQRILTRSSPIYNFTTIRSMQNEHSFKYY